MLRNERAVYRIRSWSFSVTNQLLEIFCDYTVLCLVDLAENAASSGSFLCPSYLPRGVISLNWKLSPSHRKPLSYIDCHYCRRVLFFDVSFIYKVMCRVIFAVYCRLRLLADLLPGSSPTSCKRLVIRKPNAKFTSLRE